MFYLCSFRTDAIATLASREMEPVATTSTKPPRDFPLSSGYSMKPFAFANDAQMMVAGVTETSAKCRLHLFLWRLFL